MKKDTHPKYYKEASARCACGNTFTFGATKEKIEVEICSKCHPFYTGSEHLIDTAKRAEKFRARKAKANLTTQSKPKKKEKIAAKKDIKKNIIKIKNE